MTTPCPSRYTDGAGILHTCSKAAEPAHDEHIDRTRSIRNGAWLGVIWTTANADAESEIVQRCEHARTTSRRSFDGPVKVCQDCGATVDR